MQWKILSLVNETCVASKEDVCHKAYKNQTAVHRTEELLDELWSLGLIINRGHHHNYQYMMTDLGYDYVNEAIKPIRNFK